MGLNRVLQPSDLTTGRLTIDLKKTIEKLNIDKTPLMKLLTQIGKESAAQMKFQWLTKERRSDWGTLTSIAATGWGAGASVSGTITVPAAEVWKYVAGDIIQIPSLSAVNLFVVSVATPTLTCTTFDNTTTVDLSAYVAGDNKIFNVTNSFEIGGGKGTMKSFQPSEAYNYIQIIQHPYGVVEELTKVDYEAGGKELAELEQETLIEHEFAKEKTFFFGQKYLATTGYENGTFAQYFTGGLLEAITTNATTETDLTQAEFASWINSSIYYAKKPIIFAGAKVFEALSFWLGEKLTTRQDEKTLGIAVKGYLTQYGDEVMVIPHRELFKNDYAGYAFCIDLADVKYKFLQGEDTHLEVGIQTTGYKQIINEYRTWFGAYIGNEKRHGVLKGVETISA